MECLLKPATRSPDFQPVRSAADSYRGTHHHVCALGAQQQKRQKQYQSMLDGLKAGSRVRTIGGIYGTVTAVKGDVVFVSVGPDKVRLVFTKQAIASIEDSPVEATLDGEIVDSSEKR